MFHERFGRFDWREAWRAGVVTSLLMVCVALSVWWLSTTVLHTGAGYADH